MNKNYLWNYALVGANAIAKVVDVYLTYKGIKLDPNFVENNPIMRKIIHNKPLTYSLSFLYIAILSGLNYGAKKGAEYFKYNNLIKIATIGLGLSLIMNLGIIGNNLVALKNLGRLRI